MLKLWLAEIIGLKKISKPNNEKLDGRNYFSLEQAK